MGGFWKALMRHFRHAALVRKHIDSVPDSIIGPLQNRLNRRGTSTKQLKKANNWARTVTVGTSVYATDGSRGFYLLRERCLVFSDRWKTVEKQPATYWKLGAEKIYLLHEGRVSTERPAGFISAATWNAGNYGGLDGSPRDWAPHANPDLDYDPEMATQLHQDNTLQAQWPITGSG